MRENCDLDLAVANNGDNRVYENTGGALSLAWSGGDVFTFDVAWGDWDGDGDLDLAEANYGVSLNNVYENTGGGLSLAWQSTESEDTLAVAWG